MVIFIGRCNYAASSWFVEIPVGGGVAVLKVAFVVEICILGLRIAPRSSLE